MINIGKNKWIPSEGFKYISNGEIWTDSIYLGTGDNIDNWYDTNEEPQVDVDSTLEENKEDNEEGEE